VIGNQYDIDYVFNIFMVLHACNGWCM